MTQEQMSFAAGVACIAIAFFLAGLHVVTDPKRTRWLSLNRFQRWGIVAMMLVSGFRGIQFLSPVPVADHSVGLIQPGGLLFVSVLLLNVAIGVVTVALDHMPPFMWDRLRWVKHEEKRDPTLRPVMMKEAELVDTFRMVGVPTVSPNAQPHELHDPPRSLH